MRGVFFRSFQLFSGFQHKSPCSPDCVEHQGGGRVAARDPMPFVGCPGERASFPDAFQQSQANWEPESARNTIRGNHL